LQYSLVRVKNIARKLLEAGLAASVDAAGLPASRSELWDDDLWDLILGVAQIEELIEKAASTLELSLLARHALELSQQFHGVYHRHPILQEKDPERRTVRLATALIFQRGLETLCGILGVPVPERM
jgi:arginyl-tRNA synthetase